MLADFNTGFVALIDQLFGIKVPLPPKTWNYHIDAGVTKEQEKQIWQHIENSTFQYDLPSYDWTPWALRFLNNLQVENDVYFVTSRHGSTAKFQTEAWLRKQGSIHPTVIISHRKGEIAKGIELTHFIDDKPENVSDVMRVSCVKECAIFDAPYNQHFNARGVTRVTNLLEWLEDVAPEEDEEE